MMLKRVILSVAGCVIVGAMIGLAFPVDDQKAAIILHPAPSLDSQATQQSRRVLATRWDTLAVVETASLGADLEGAFRLAVVKHGLAVFADRGERLFVFDMVHKTWHASRPGAIRFARDLKADYRGRLLVVDQRATTLWSYSRAAALLDSERVGAIAGIEQIAPLPDGRIVAFAPDMPRPLFVLGAGAANGLIALPDPRLQSWQPLQRQGLLASDPNSSHWVYALELADGWFSFDGVRSKGFVGQYVEHTPSPIVVSDSVAGGQANHLGRAVVSAISATVYGSVVSILFGGRTKLRDRVIDRYRRDTGAYLGSYILPDRCAAIAAIADSTYAVLSSARRPTLLVLRAR
ncbi:MAG TPA: hypothetical protein VFK16_01730 [Gemmatimonadaceae bacterium]|nr:hypothetical protein [Gemmatimonadaceae bacterium]